MLNATAGPAASLTDLSRSAQSVSPEIVQTYALRRAFFEEYAYAIESVLRQTLDRRSIRYLDIQSRAKSVESFRGKAGRLAEDGISLKYNNPIVQLTDLAACRVIVFFPRTLQEVEETLRAELDVVEKVDHSARAFEEGRLGYLSVHFLVQLKVPRVELPEYERFDGTTAEIQVRTVMQHAWAEIEHDIQYKSSYSVPKELTRRFVTLAGLLEVADREFQSIQDRDQQLRNEAKASVKARDFAGLEVTPTSIKEYLDQRLGPDNRMRSWSYELLTRIVKSLGVDTIEDLDAATRGYNDDALSRAIAGSRVGQVGRFEHVLLAAYGEAYVQKHPWAREPWFHDAMQRDIVKLRRAGLIPDSPHLPAEPDVGDESRTPVEGSDADAATSPNA